MANERLSDEAESLETGGAKVSEDAVKRAQAALEAAGVEFTNGDGEGVRLRKGKRK
jgi:hypothetical protein